MRVDSFQMSYNDESGAAKGTIYLDDLRLARVVTGVQDEEPLVQGLPIQFHLFQNYPNPFNPRTNITYQLAEGNHVHLRIFNVTGQTVRGLVDENQPAGTYSVRWDGRDDHGLPVASGVYFCHLQTGRFSKSCKMTLMR